MRIQLKYFASIREALGTSGEEAVLPPQLSTIADVRAWLCARGPVWAEALGGEKRVRCALDHQMTDPAARVREGCEVAFFPPVTGG
ncbi:MAG: molybdopterin converting factor subunit 1 [Candidatus Protistobacter heckmanni]|nr:molybdopterin converting factor subunit 1 [Candidatus Protistobacter heckmanni]